MITVYTKVLVQVHPLDRYEQKWPKMLPQVQRLDLYEHLGAYT